MLWFHEYDDLDVEVGDLAGVEWGAVEEEETVLQGHVKKQGEVKVEDVGIIMGMDGRKEKGWKM